MPAARSRLGLATKAVRPSLKARMTIAGPSGSGKTTEALMIAQVLGQNIVVIDTERESALTYADEFAFEHIPWAAPYDPADLVATLADVRNSGHDVVIVDSFSHWWNGEGGILEIANGKFTGWKDARPAHAAVISAILDCPAHVILCLRSKTAYTQEDDPRGGGRQRVSKLGMEAVQDSTLEYEVNLALDVEHPSHKLYVTKSRAGIPVGTEFGSDQVRQFATRYRDWLAGGDDDFAPLEVRAALQTRVLALPSEGRKRLWDRMKAHGLRENFDTYTESQAATLDDLLGMVESGKSVERSGETATTGGTVGTLRNQAMQASVDKAADQAGVPEADPDPAAEQPGREVPVAPTDREPAPKSPVRTGVLNRLREIADEGADVDAIIEQAYGMPVEYVTTAELRSLMERLAS